MYVCMYTCTCTCTCTALMYMYIKNLYLYIYYVPGGCQYEIDTPEGELNTPQWPDYYPSRKDCVWHFTATPGHRVKLVSRDCKKLCVF